MSKFTEYLEGTKPSKNTIGKRDDNWIQFLLRLEETNDLEIAINGSAVKNLESVQNFIKARKNLIKDIKDNAKLFKKFISDGDGVDIKFLDDIVIK